MQNPFESGQIKNYLLLYGSVVVIMILFFIATTLFNENEETIEAKKFNTELNASQKEALVQKKKEESVIKHKFKLLDESY